MVSLDNYIVTPDGIIYDKKTDMPIKTFKSNKYLQCCIYDENGKHVMGVHNVVAQALCKDWFEGCVVHHKDNNQHNNNVDNLECMLLSDHTKQHQNIKYQDKMMVCPECGKDFLWGRIAQNHWHSDNVKTGPYCSRQCARRAINGKRIKCFETNVVYNSIKQASELLNVSYGSIYSCMRRNTKTTFGLHFEFV